MPLPNLPEFEALLTSLEVVEPKDKEEWLEETLIPEEVVQDGSRIDTRPTIRVWYKEGKLTFNALLRKLQSELQRIGHRSDEVVVRTFIGFFAHRQRSQESQVEVFNKVFSHFGAADLNQYFIFSMPSPPAYQFKIGKFSIGPFRPSRLSYQCQKAKSDFYERYESVLERLPLAVEREHFRITLIDWWTLLSGPESWKMSPKTPGEIRSQLWSNYFKELGRLYFDDFYRELYDAQEVGIALGSGWFDPRLLNEMVSAFRVSVFLNVGEERHGFVSPASVGFVQLDLGGAHLGLPTTEEVLKRQFGFDSFTECEIHQMMRSYFHFLALAARHHHGGRTAEGFLHSVIAIDLLLGEKNATTQAVTKRAATLCLGRKTALVQAINECERVYDGRSRYVHQGQRPDDELASLASEISREIGFCLLRLQHNSANRLTGFRDRWVREIDYVTAALKAGRNLPTADLANVGIEVEGQFGLSNYQAMLRTKPS